MRFGWVLIAASVALSACQTSQGFKAPPGVSDAKFQEDTDRCTVEVLRQVPQVPGEWNGPGNMNYDLRSRLLASCMRGKGYTTGA